MIAVARSEGDDLENIRFVGLLPLSDPPRPDSRGTIEEARNLGIKSVMLTGDNLAIAKEIAAQVGIGSNIIKLADLEGLSDDEQVRNIGESNGFAEIYPEDKYRIVKILQSRGQMVGMTGDGVNDAPALKQAEMGIAVSNCNRCGQGVCERGLNRTGCWCHYRCGNHKQADLSTNADMGHQ